MPYSIHHIIETLDPCTALVHVYHWTTAQLNQLSSALQQSPPIDIPGIEQQLTEIDQAIEKLQIKLEKKIFSEILNYLLSILEPRFSSHQYRHENIQWTDIANRLTHAPLAKLRSLHAMEITGGEPDVVGYDVETGEYIFEDRSPESPQGRRNCCYDKEGELTLQQPAFLKMNLPPHSGNAIELAAQMGITLLDEPHYLAAQEQEKAGSSSFMDQNSWSWLYTPPDTRKDNFAIAGDCISGSVIVRNFRRPDEYIGHGAFRGWLSI